MNQFRKYLRTQLAYLHKLADQPEYEDTDYQDAGAIVAEASRRASKLGFGQWAKYAACEQLAPQRAREILAEMIAANQSTSKTLTPPEVAKRYGVSADTVRKWISDGELKATKVGKRRHRVTLEALAEFDQKRKPAVKVKQPAQRRGRPAKLLVKRFSA